MLARLKQHWQKSQLTDPRYLALFEPQSDDIVSVDCETTSLNVAEAELLSIGAVKIRGNRILHSEALYLLVKPEKRPDAGNISVHGLRPRDLDQALPPQQAVAQLLDFIGGNTLTGYFLEYDVAVLNKYVKGVAGCSLPNRRIEISSRYYDYKFRQHPDSHVDLKLQTLIDALKVPALPRHDALGDAITAAMLYLALKRRGFG